MQRIILHIDMDYFFAQIEERENPRFKGKPVVVGADPKKGEGRGVVSTANYEARKYGIHSALPISKAYQLCPEAVFLPVNMELYKRVSENIMEIVKKYLPRSTPSESEGLLRGFPKMEIVSLDEAFLDLSFLSNLSIFSTIVENIDKRGVWERAKELAKKLRKEILEKEKLIATVGVGPNKLIAKMATNRAKPNGLLIIRPKEVKKFLEPLDIEKLPGIGPKTAEKLRNIGINKIKELKRLSRIRLKNLFGVVGENIYKRVRGIDGEEVSSEEIIKSISKSASWRTKGEKRFISSTGKEHTFERDTRDPEIIFNTFEKIIEEIGRGLSSAKLSFKTITVICRFSGFETYTKSKTLKEVTNNLEILKSEAKKLLLKFLIENPKDVRLIGLRIKIC